ncbi:MAG: hypothetical protein ACRD1E_05470 [Terriglobales bacterium]
MLALLLAACASGVRAQVRDPLTPQEADQVRDTAGHLDRRLPLLLGFAQLRLERFEQVRAASPRPPDRDTQLYALLMQFRGILPEFDNAVDDLLSAPAKQYKTAKILDQALTRLNALNAALHRIQSDSTPSDLATYHFALDSCLDVASDSLQNVEAARTGKE